MLKNVIKNLPTSPATLFGAPTLVPSKRIPLSKMSVAFMISKLLN